MDVLLLLPVVSALITTVGVVVVVVFVIVVAIVMDGACLVTAVAQPHDGIQVDVLVALQDLLTVSHVLLIEFVPLLSSLSYSQRDDVLSV